MRFIVDRSQIRGNEVVEGLAFAHHGGGRVRTGDIGNRLSAVHPLRLAAGQWIPRTDAPHHEGRTRIFIFRFLSGLFVVRMIRDTGSLEKFLP